MCYLTMLANFLLGIHWTHLAGTQFTLINIIPLVHNATTWHKYMWGGGGGVGQWG